MHVYMYVRIMCVYMYVYACMYVYVRVHMYVRKIMYIYIS
jgi:hypothetical protein